MMRVCYLLQTHKNPEQIERLVRTIKHLSPNSHIVISHDFVCSQLDIETFQQLPNVHVLSAKGGRGDFSTVQTYLQAVDWLINQSIPFDWLINLTGQDYPTQPLAQVEQFLAETPYDGFLEYFPVFSQESPWGIREGITRYFFNYRSLVSRIPEWQKEVLTPLKIINYLQPFFRINVSYGITVGLRTQVPFNSEFTCYGGSFFCTLSRRCVEYLHHFWKSNPDVVQYYQSVCQSDESFIQTVLLNSHQFNLCNDCKRYFDFSNTRNGHPRILNTEDYPSLVHSETHFARKFDINQSQEILDLLDSKILQNV